MNKKFIVIAVVIVIIVGLVYYNRNKLFKKSELKPEEAKLPVNNGFNVAEPDTSNDNFPLIKGSKGPKVKTLQLALNKLNEQQGSKYDPLVPDSIYGDKTSDLLIKVAGVGYLMGNGINEQSFNNLIILSTK